MSQFRRTYGPADVKEREGREPGSSVAIVGAGPIGLAALLTAQFYAPAEIIMIDLDDNRLAVGKRFGPTAPGNTTDRTARPQVLQLKGGVDRQKSPVTRAFLLVCGALARLTAVRP